MANDKRVFGSGKARIGVVGGTLTDNANGIGDVQSASLDIQFQKKELMNSPEISMYPVAVAYYGGKVEFKLNFENFNRDVFVRTTGATSATASGVVTITLSKTSKPGYFRFEWEGVDLEGEPFKITLPNASAPGTNLALALEDFGKGEITISGYPATNGDVCLIESAA